MLILDSFLQCSEPCNNVQIGVLTVLVYRREIFSHLCASMV